MVKDVLFLLDPHSHVVANYPRFCPACAMVSGYLDFYPHVQALIEVHTVSPVRPRAAIVEILGDENQGSPVLILKADSVVPEGVETQEHNGLRFIDNERQILRYLGKAYDAGLSLGDQLG
jgi:hypothetical protein